MTPAIDALLPSVAQNWIGSDAAKHHHSVSPRVVAHAVKMAGRGLAGRPLNPTEYLAESRRCNNKRNQENHESLLTRKCVHILHVQTPGDWPISCRNASSWRNTINQTPFLQERFIHASTSCLKLFYPATDTQSPRSHPRTTRPLAPRRPRSCARRAGSCRRHGPRGRVR